MRKRFTPVFLCLFLVSCSAAVDKPNDVFEEEALEVASSFDTPLSVAQQLVPEASYQLEINLEYNLAKYEPQSGAYAGAYILKDKSVTDINDFERLTGVSHALYTYNIVLGEGSPADFLLQCTASGKTPSVTINPPAGNAYDSELLLKTAQDLGTYNLPVFVNFYPYAYGNGYSSEEYVAFFREAKAVFDEYAPKAAMVWSVYYSDVYDCSLYYPGDDFVDWVGISIYDDVDDEGNFKDVVAPLQYFYYLYQHQKPLMVFELAIGHYNGENNAYYTYEAAAELKRVYAAIAELPRVKAVIYMDYNGVQNGGITGNDYTLTSEGYLLDAYEQSVGDGTGYIGKLESGGGTAGILVKSPFAAYQIGDEYYISHKALQYDIAYTDLDLLEGKELTIEGEKHYSLKTINMISPLDFHIDEMRGVLVMQFI